MHYILQIICYFIYITLLCITTSWEVTFLVWEQWLEWLYGINLNLIPKLNNGRTQEAKGNVQRCSTEEKVLRCLFYSTVHHYQAAVDKCSVTSVHLYRATKYLVHLLMLNKCTIIQNEAIRAYPYMYCCARCASNVLDGCYALHYIMIIMIAVNKIHWSEKLVGIQLVNQELDNVSQLYMYIC